MDEASGGNAQPPPAGAAPPNPDASAAAPGSTGEASAATLQATLAALSLAQRMAAARPAGPGQEPKLRYAFWETQPVPQFGEAGDGPPGPIAPPRDPATLRADPFTLPAGLAWADLDVGGDGAAAEELAALLAAHYVSDAADAFRFAYSPAFLAWALAVPPVEPGAPSAWCVGVRATASGRLVAFIGAVPARLRVPGALGDGGGGAGAAAPPAPPPSPPLPAAEVNFLCVHKKLRAKRLAPVLIRELTRRINAAGVWQAVYTAGVVLPRPAAVARYWHRSLDVAKLCAVGFTRLPPRMTMAQAARLHRLPGTASTPGLRPMRAADAPGVGSLLRAYLARYPLAPVLSDAEVAHCLTPRDGVVYSYVVEAPPKKGGPGEGTLGSAIISDLVSFYTLPSTVVGGAGGHATLKAAFQYYTVPGSASAKGLVADALVLARDTCVRL